MPAPETPALRRNTAAWSRLLAVALAVTLLSELVAASSVGADPTVPAPTELPFDYPFDDGQGLSDLDADAFLLAEVNRTRLSYGLEPLAVTASSAVADCITAAMVATRSVTIPASCRAGHTGAFLVAGQAFRVTPGSGAGPAMTFAADWLETSSRAVMLEADWEMAAVSAACVVTPASPGDPDQRPTVGVFVAVLPFNSDGHRPGPADVALRGDGYESSNQLRGTVACSDDGRWRWRDADLPVLPASGELGDQVRRLYLATFLRDADAAGLAHWREAIAEGLPVSEAARAFAASSEFDDRYGSLDNSAFVSLLYRNVLEREADAEGLALWVAALDSGELDRGEVLLGFANSVEFIGATSTLRPGERGDLFRLYQAVFLRDPDEGGFHYWASRNLSLRQVAAEFVISPEFVATYGSLTDAEFVDLVYRNVLGRLGDAEGRAFWVEQLEAGGATRAEMMIGFSESPEFKLSTGTL
ncbi:MAG: DUF4214 domain-containing protein [Acidimicrobiales bacterium]